MIPIKSRARKHCEHCAKQMERRIEIVTILMLCLSWQAHAAVNCTAAGRFPDDEDTTCQNYVLCVYNRITTSYLSYNYTCPTTSVFNPNTATCTASANYVCNVTTANTTSVCEADGFVADPNSINCTSYIECVDISGNFSETSFICPNNTFFNPNTTLCETNYICPTADTATAFNCTAAGRFANATDTTCQSYFFCVLQTDATYVQYNYTCPSVSVFNPTSKVCTTTYNCTTS